MDLQEILDGLEAARLHPVTLEPDAGGVRHVRYVTEMGATLWLRPVPQLKRAMVLRGMQQDPAWGAYPEPPTYTVELAGGGTEQVPLTAESADSAEDKARWQAYVTRCQAWDMAYAERLLDMLLMFGVAGVALPDDGGEWIAAQRAAYMATPGDDAPAAVWRVHFIKTELLGSNEERVLVTSLVNLLSGNREALAVWQLFRRAVGGSATSEDSAGGAEAATEPVGVGQ